MSPFSSHNKEFNSKPTGLMDSLVLPVEKSQNTWSVFWPVPQHCGAMLANCHESRAQDIDPEGSLQKKLWTIRRNIVCNLRISGQTNARLSLPSLVPRCKQFLPEQIKSRSKRSSPCVTGCTTKMSPLDHLHTECKVLSVQQYHKLLSTQFFF